MGLDAPLLRWAATVVWNRCSVDDRRDFKTRGLKRTNGRFTTGAGSTYEDAHLAHAVLHGFFGGGISSEARRVWRAFARALKARGTGRAPGQHISIRIRDRHDGVVEAGLDVRVATRDV